MREFEIIMMAIGFTFASHIIYTIIHGQIRDNEAHKRKSSVFLKILNLLATIIFVVFGGWAATSVIVLIHQRDIDNIEREARKKERESYQPFIGSERDLYRIK